MPTTHTTSVALTFAVAATATSAQTTAFNNQNASASSVDAIEEQIANDNDRNISNFGNNGRQLGDYGSVWLRATATTDDDSLSSDGGVGLRYGSYDGINGYDVTLSYTYGETDGTVSENNLVAGLDYRRDFGANLFAYGKADIAFDRTADQTGDYSQELFAGAGVGYRFANIVGGSEVREAAARLSSNFFTSLSDTSYVTNDTDVIYSEAATVVTNEMALNVSMTDQL